MEDWFNPEGKATDDLKQAKEALVDELARHPHQQQFLREVVRLLGAFWQETQNRNRFEEAQGIREAAAQLVECGRLAEKPKKK